MSGGLLDKIGKFKIIKRIGQSVGATVYLARDAFMQRYVAIKVIDLGSAYDEKTKSRLTDLFYNEARIYGMLNNNYILPVFDAGEENDRLYIVMEYIESSRTLQAYCRKDSLLPVPRVIDILYRCCKGLQYAHSRKVIHMDLKPNNILITRDDDIKIADFGISRVLNLDQDWISPDKATGTPSYMSPEQLRKDPLNQQTDLYSLGVVMYYLLTGELPFQAPDRKVLLMKILKEEPPSLNYYREDIPEILEPIIGKALAKELDRRYLTAAEFASDLFDANQRLLHSVLSADMDTRAKIEMMEKIDFFKDFYEKELFELLSAGQWLGEEAGKWIVTEKDIDDSFYIIIDGEANVYRDNALLASLKPGECFGQLAYIKKKERTVSIGASTDIVLLKIHRELMEKTSVNCQFKFIKTFLTSLLMRLSVNAGRQ